MSWSMELEELQMHADGSRAYRLLSADVSEFAAESWESANTPSVDMEWTCEDDMDEPDDVVPVLRSVLDHLWECTQEYDRIMSLCVHAPRCECE